jgi:long-chain fatty acid transport protein
MGMCGAQIADPKDASAFYYNQAGLLKINGTSLQLGIESILAGGKYRWSECGADFSKSSENGIIPLPFGGFSTHLTDRLAAGIGWHVVGGLGSKYKGDFPWKEGMLSLTSMVPALAYQISEKLSVGLSLNIGYAQFVNSGRLQLGSFRVDQVGMDAEASGIGVGGGVGFLYEFNDDWTVGASYTFPTRVHLKGSTKLALLGLPIGDYETTTDANFPGRLGLGLKGALNDSVTVLADVNWYDYSAAQKMTAELGGLLKYSQKLNWNDNFSLHLGTEYKLSEKWLVRSGICWHTAAIPRETETPTAPEIAGPGVSLGVGYQANEKWTCDLGYTYGWGKREVENHPGFLAPGKYEVEIHVVSASVTWHFGGRQ